MKKDTIDQLFSNLEGQFDVHTPVDGHEMRFLEKLDNKKEKKTYWKSFIAIAASVIICVGLFTTFNNKPEVLDLASVSPELSEAQDFFSITIETELKKLDLERSPETEDIIHDALRQIKILEDKYEILKQDLTETDGDQRVIYAMISNFQSRIDVLNNVLEQIENYKQLKSKNDENTITI
ncbi:MAG: hypothetical protein AAF901_10565 [Bacteroidota bacterium]